MNKGKKNQKAEEPAITEEDKQTTDPFLRALAKKVRNINKKITDIEVLEKRDDLKPEQQDKINSKPSIVEQRKKYEEFAKFYKSTLAENKDESANQLVPVLAKVSNALVTAQYLRTGATLGNLEFTAPEKKIFSNLVNIGTEESTLRNLTTNLSGLLGEYLENQKLVAKVEEAYANEDLANTNVVLTVKEVQKLTVNANHKDTPQKKQYVAKEQKQTKQIRQPQVQEVKQPVVPEVVVQSQVQPQVQTQPAPQPVQQTTVDDSWVDAPVAPVATPAVVNPTVPAASEENTQAVLNQTETQPAENQKPAQKHDRYQKKPYDPNRSNYRPREGGNREGGYREGGNNGYREGGYRNYNNGERNQYRPKYQEKQVDNKSDTSLEDSDNEDKRRKFNNKQINDLQSEGFVVVQKKPRTNEVNDHRDYHRNQFGYNKRPNHQN